MIVFDILNKTMFLCVVCGEKKIEEIISSHSKQIQALYLSLSHTHTHFRERERERKRERKREKEKEKEKTPRALFVFFVIKILRILLRLLHAFFYTDSLERRRRR